MVDKHSSVRISTCDFRCSNSQVSSCPGVSLFLGCSIVQSSALPLFCRHPCDRSHHADLPTADIGHRGTALCCCQVRSAVELTRQTRMVALIPRPSGSIPFVTARVYRWCGVSEITRICGLCGLLVTTDAPGSSPGSANLPMRPSESFRISILTRACNACSHGGSPVGQPLIDDDGCNRSNLRGCRRNVFC